MRCPKHPDVWLYEDTMEQTGYCPKCKKSYDLFIEIKTCKLHGVNEWVDLVGAFCPQCEPDRGKEFPE